MSWAVVLLEDETLDALERVRGKSWRWGSMVICTGLGGTSASLLLCTVIRIRYLECINPFGTGFQRHNNIKRKQSLMFLCSNIQIPMLNYRVMTPT